MTTITTSKMAGLGSRVAPRRFLFFGLILAAFAVPGAALAWWPESLAGDAGSGSAVSWSALVFCAPLAAILAGGCLTLRTSNARLRSAISEMTSERDRLADTARRHEAALRQVNAESEALITLVRREKATLEECAKTVSHDLRGSLTAIKGFAKLLVRDVRIGDEERIGDDIDQILEAADKMVLMLDDLKRIRRGDVTWADAMPPAGGDVPSSLTCN